jgi:hypothetical protein
MKLNRILGIVAALGLAAPAWAQVTTVQGTASDAATATGRPVRIGGKDAAGNAKAIFADAVTGEVGVTSAARTLGKTSEVIVTNLAGGTAVPATPLANRKGIELQNLGPNAIYCTIDGQAPLSTGALGRRVGPASESPGNTWSLDIGPSIVITCIAAVAAQVTTAATQVTEVR